MLQAIVPWADVGRMGSGDCGMSDKCDALPHTHHTFQYARPNKLFDSSECHRQFYTGQDAGDTDAERIKLLKQGDPEGMYWMPAMSDAPLRGYNGRHEWFWEPGDEEHIYPLENLMNMYYRSVGHNSTLILGITPDPDGLIPEPDANRMKEFGDEIKRRFSKPLASVKGKGNILTLDMENEKQINHVIIMEEISEGERVREFILERFSNGKWITLCSGTCIGHKYIQQFDTANVTKVKLTISRSIAEPVIKNLSVFYVE